MEFVPIISGVVSAIGSIAGGNAAAATSERNAQMADYNARVANMQADSALQAANANEEAKRRENAANRGAQNAALAENGMLGTETGYDLTTQSALNTELDALNIRYQGQVTANNYRNQSQLDTYDAANSRANASAQRTAGYMGAAGSVLSGVGGYYTNQNLKRAAAARQGLT